MESKERLAEKVENRLQFVITISVFFGALLYNFFKFTNTNELDSNGIVLQESSLVVVFICSYLLFSIYSKKIPVKWLKRLDHLVLFSVGCFVFPMIVMADKLQRIPFYISIPMSCSMYLLTGTSLLTLVLIVFFGVKRNAS